MKEQFRLNINAGDGIGIERSTNGENWAQDIYINTGAVGSTAKLTVKLLYLLEDFENRSMDECPEEENCPDDIKVLMVREKCPICWDRFFDKKVDELGK